MGEFYSFLTLLFSFIKSYLKVSKFLANQLIEPTGTLTESQKKKHLGIYKLKTISSSLIKPGHQKLTESKDTPGGIQLSLTKKIYENDRGKETFITIIIFF